MYRTRMYVRTTKKRRDNKENEEKGCEQITTVRQDVIAKKWVPLRPWAKAGSRQ